MASKRQHCFILSPNKPEKRFKWDSTILEILPNELFIEIFGYLSDVDIVYTFSQLNRRFQNLILNYCYIFDFKTVNKVKFNQVIQEHNTQQWQSLRLSDDDDTPGQITLFSQRYPFAKYVPQLKSLSLINMKLKHSQIIIPQLRTFTQLVSLTIGSICGKTISMLELPSLKYLMINSCKHSQWMKNFPRLESLEHNIEYKCIHENNLIWPTNLKRLKIVYTRSNDSEIVYSSLSRLSQLEKLSVCDCAWANPPPDGQKWEKLICSSLPLLKTFQFCFKFWKDSVLIKDLNRVISTFATPFYLEEKRWFIRCDIHYQQFSAALLYSLPFAFERFEIVTHSFVESITTSDFSNTKTLYKNVNTLVADVKCEHLHPSLMNNNVKNLVLKFSGIPANWIYSMNQLRQLSLSNQIDILPIDFTRLVDNMPLLTSLIASYNTLKFLTNSWRNKLICRQLSYKILSLKLCSEDYSSLTTQDYVKVDELLDIVRVFGKKCQHLTVAVYSRNLVAGLILRTMRHLHSLKVTLKEHDNLIITKDWLKEQDISLKNLDCSIINDGNEYFLWFDKLF